MEFIEQICKAEINFAGLSVRYQSPSQGWLEFGWRGPLKKSGKVIPLDQYPRYDNPYCQADFWAEEIHIHHQNEWLKLDWVSATREFSATI